MPKSIHDVGLERGDGPTLISRRVLGKDELATLGSVVAESTYLEEVVERLIRSLSRLSAAEMGTFLSKAMFAAKLDILAELGERKLKSAKRKARFKKIIQTLRNNNSERVTAVHGVWSIVDDAHKGRRARATHSRGGLISAQSLSQLAERIDAGRHELFAFYLHVWVMPRVPRRMKALAKAGVIELPRK